MSGPGESLALRYTLRGTPAMQVSNPPKRGRERREWLGRGIRRCGHSELFQLRVRVGPLKNDSVHFGTYVSVSEAKRVRKLISALWKPPMSIWDVLAMLQASGDVPRRVLPRWVYRREGGGFGAKVKHGPRQCHLPGPYETAAAAHDAMREHLGLPPLGPRLSRTIAA